MMQPDLRTWRMLGAAAWAVGLAAAAALVVPALRERAQLREEIESLWFQHDHAVDSTAHAAALEQQTQVLKSMHEGLAVRLPDVVDAEELREQLRTEAATAGLRIESIEIAPREMREFYGQQAVRVVATGPAHGAHAMLSGILQAPPLRRIRALLLERTKDEPASSLRLEIELHAYDYGTR